MASNDNHETNRQETTNGGVFQIPPEDAEGIRLTAYVLDELSVDERAAVDRDLAASGALRREVAEIRRSVGFVTAGLATEPMADLSVADPPTVEPTVSPRETHSSSSPTSAPRKAFTRYVMAACVLFCIAGGLTALLLPAIQADREAVRRATAQSQLRELQMESGVKPAAAPKPLPYAVGGRTASLRQSDKTPYQIRKPTYETQSRFAVVDGPAKVAQGVASRSDAAEGLIVAGSDRGGINAPEIRGESLRDSLRSDTDFATESYARIYENPFLDVRQNPLSTFSIDVDTASYANVRRFLNGGSLPPKDAVRIEELVNYFTYHYAPPADDRPFAVHAEVAGCPWEPKHRLLRIALKGREIDLENRLASNLVFLIDVSGSMDDPAKLPLLKSALHLLIDKLGENDRVAMVVYAGSSGLVLPSTSGMRKEIIEAALDQLQAGGSTNGGSGIELAYKVAREKFIRGGTNRVILCTDGDFNVGVTDEGSLTRLIEGEAKSGVFLSVLGFGTGNLKDSTMEKLADRGNGNYAYIDTPNEARKVLVEQLGGTLVTIAKDVKLQLEFNPRKLAAYRLIGYENRLLRAEDFNDDQKDAGEIGAGHTVTALYELVPAGDEVPTSKVDALKYQGAAAVSDIADPEAPVNRELLTLKLRYKDPDGDKSKLIESAVNDSQTSYARASEDFRFAAAVAGFGLLLRDSQHKGDLTWGAVLELAAASRGTDENGYRAEFIELVKKGSALPGR